MIRAVMQIAQQHPVLSALFWEAQASRARLPGMSLGAVGK